MQYDVDGQPIYNEWEDVRRILAMFCAAPFVEVENDHLRQLLIKQDPSYAASDRMGFGMRQLRVDTLPDIVDSLQCSLTMSWFNYRPYSRDFAFLGLNKAHVDSYQSPAFANYLDNWISKNLDNPPALQDYPFLENWRAVTPGSLKFNWRRYIAVPKVPKKPGILDGTQSSSAGVGSPTLPRPAIAGQKRANAPLLTGPYQTRLVTAIAAAIKEFEGWKPGTLGANGQRSGGTRSWRNCNPGNLRIPGSTMSGGYTLFPTEEAGQAGLEKDIKAKFRTYPQFTFQDFFNRYAPASDSNDPARYARQVIGKVNTWLGTKFTVANTLPQIWNNQGAAPAAPAKVSAFEENSPQSRPQSTSSIPAQMQTVKQADAPPDADTDDETFLLNNGYLRDFKTDLASFFYLPESKTLTDQEHSGTDIGLFPTQLSVVFVNSIVQMPLSSFQYPTAQHIGAAGTMISISMTSAGEIIENGEPQHETLGTITGAMSMLEDQYHRMKGEWRSVRSLHCMQAMVLENQVLNMLGIYGVMPQGMDTQTMPESANLAQVFFNCSQYENVFEQIHPFIVKGTAEYDKIWQKEVFEGDYLSKLVPDDPVLDPLRGDWPRNSLYHLRPGKHKFEVRDPYSALPADMPDFKERRNHGCRSGY